MVGLVFTDRAIWKMLGIAFCIVVEGFCGSLCATRMLPPLSPLAWKKAALMNTWVGVDWERGCVMGRVVEANAERLEFPLLIINGEGGGGGFPKLHCASRSF